MNKIALPGGSEGSAPPEQPHAPPLYIDNNELRETFRKIWRRRGLIFGIMLFLMTLATIELFQIPPTYTATAEVIIDPRSSKVIDLEAVLTGAARDTEAIFSEAEVLTSRQLIEKLVDKLDLKTYPEFNASLRHRSLWQRLNPLNLIPADWLAALRGNPVSPTAEERELRQKSALVSAVLQRLKVAPRTRTRVLAINVTSENPRTAALIANTLADLYVVDQLEAKFEATQRVTSWLNDRLTDLRKKVDASELAVEAYRAKSGLLGGKGATLVEQQISELNSQLTIARGDRNATEARLKQAREAFAGPQGEGAVLELFESPQLQHLREKQIEIEHSISELSTQYGERHPKLIAARSQLEDLKNKISSELRSALLAVEHTANVARAREAAVVSQLEEMKRQLAQSNTSEVQLRALEMEASTNRTLMETFMSRFKETSAQESGGIQTADARIISRADVPQTPSYPKKGQFLIFATLVSGLIGIVSAFITEHLDRGFRSGVQFEQVTAIPVLALIPALEESKGLPSDYLVERPLSGYAEAIRSVYASLLLTQGGDPLRTIAVTSSQPSEGKSTLSLSLARTVAAAGHRAILVEADLRRPSIHTQLRLERHVGLAEVLVGTAHLEDVLYRDPKTSVDILLAGKDTLNPTKLIASHQMSVLLARLRSEYDVVIIDTAPVLAVSDALIVANMADGTIFSCKWAETPRETAALGLKELRTANSRVVGAVLSKVNMKKSRTYGYADTAYYNYVRKYYKE
jgi:succinoglycan biosynthesis transport protein ExoP